MLLLLLVVCVASDGERGRGVDFPREDPLVRFLVVDGLYLSLFLLEVNNRSYPGVSTPNKSP